MAYADVDIELSEFETHELVEELIKRFKTWKKRNQVTDKEKAELKETLLPLLQTLKMRPMECMKIVTLDEQIKFDHLVSVWEKYTSFQRSLITLKQ